MVQPKHRVPIAAVVALLSIAPAIGFLAFKGQSQSSRNAAESLRNERLTTVTQDVLNKSCYVSSSIVKGSELTIPDSVPASSCVTDGNRYGFIAVASGRLRILETYTPTEINATKSNLLKGKK